MRLPHRFPKIEYVGDRVKFVLDLSVGKSVLHIGCADPANIKKDEVLEESHLHSLLISKSKEVYGVDLDEKSINLLKNNYKIQNLYIGNAQELENLPFQKKFDVIIAPELIEHLNNPGMFLEGAKRFMHKDSKLVITTPNSFALKTWIWGIIKKESANPEHTFIFHPSGIKLIQSMQGFDSIKLYSATYNLYSRRNGTVRNLIANSLLNLYFPFMPHHADCLISIATIKSL